MDPAGPRPGSLAAPRLLVAPDGWIQRSSTVRSVDRHQRRWRAIWTASLQVARVRRARLPLGRSSRVPRVRPALPGRWAVGSLGPPRPTASGAGCSPSGSHEGGVDGQLRVTPTAHVVDNGDGTLHRPLRGRHHHGLSPHPGCPAQRAGAVGVPAGHQPRASSRSSTGDGHPSARAERPRGVAGAEPRAARPAARRPSRPCHPPG